MIAFFHFKNCKLYVESEIKCFIFIYKHFIYKHKVYIYEIMQIVTVKTKFQIIN